MAQDNALIRRITDRLSGDPELQADIAHEMETHLEDAAAEFRAAGLDEGAAAEQAAKVLGDPDMLAEQLWQANRTRMKFRAVVRWAASLALLPAAIAVIVLLAAQLIGSALPKTVVAISHSGGAGGWPVPARWTRNLSEEQAYVLRGDPAATSEVESAKSIADRWPDNPVYFGNYFVAAAGKYGDGPPELMDGAIALADKGERIDPDDALYNFLKAAWHIQKSSTVEEDPSRTYEAVDWTGEVSTKTFDKITITDLARFQLGLEELRRGVAKARCASRTFELLELRMSMLPPPRKFSDVVNRTALETSTLLPALGQIRHLGRAVSAHAVNQATKGDASAVEMAHSVQRMAEKLGVSSQTIIELLVATAVRQVGLIGEELAARELGDDSLAGRTFERRREQETFWKDLLSQPGVTDKELQHAGLFWKAMTPSIPGYRPDFEPLRTAENFVFLRVVLIVLLAALVLLAILFGLWTLLGIGVGRRSGQRPILLFVGWRRIGRIVLLSIVLPLTLFGGYELWQIYRPGAWGLNHTLDRSVVEVTLLLCTVITLLLASTYSAVRRRCQEIGLSTPSRITLRKRWMLALLATGVLAICTVYLVGWWIYQPGGGNEWLVQMLDELAGNPDMSKPPIFTGGMILTFLVFSLGAFWLLREMVALWQCRLPQFRRTFFRSAMPVLCSAVIVVGLAVGALLGQGETAAVRRVTGRAATDWSGELDRSAFRDLRQQFVTWREQAEVGE